MRRVLLGIAGAAALAFSTAGQAQLVIDTETVVDPETTTVTIVPPGVVSPAPYTFTAGYGDTGLTNPFTEYLVFSTSSSGTLTLSLISASFGLNFDNTLWITGTDVNGPVSLAVTSATNAFLYSTYLLAGDYTFTITGQAPNGGSFGGEIGLATHVPEPATWAMMLLGFVGLGSQVRRRRQRMQVHFA